MAGNLFDPSTLAQPLPLAPDPTVAAGAAQGTAATAASPFAGANVIVSQPNAAANGVQQQIAAATALPDTDPFSAFVKGRALGKASTAAEAIDQYQQQLQQQAATVKAQKEQLATITAMNDYVAKNVQTTLRSGYGQQALSNDPNIATPALQSILQQANTFSKIGGPGLNIDAKSAIADGQGNVVYDTIDPKTNVKTTHREPIQQMIMQYSDDDTRKLLQIQQSNSKPQELFMIDNQGIPHENVPLVSKADGTYTDSNGNPVQGKVFPNRYAYEAAQAQAKYDAANGKTPSATPAGTATPAPAAGATPPAMPTAQDLPALPVSGTNAPATLTPVAGITDGTSAEAAKEGPLNPAAVTDRALTPIQQAVHGVENDKPEANTTTVEAQPAQIINQVLSSPNLTSAEQFSKALKTAKPGEEIKVDNTADALANLSWDHSKPVPYIADKDVRTDVRYIANQVQGNQQVKNFATGVGSFYTALSLAKDQTGASDQGLVYAINKTFDPPSTVREGEAAALQNLGNVSATLKNKMSNILKSGDAGSKTKFTPEERAQLLQAGFQYLKGNANGYKQAIGDASTQLQATLGPNADMRLITNFDPAKVSALLDNKFDFKKELGVGSTSVDTSAYDSLTTDQLQLIADGKATLKDFK